MLTAAVTRGSMCQSPHLVLLMMVTGGLVPGTLFTEASDLLIINVSSRLCPLKLCISGECKTWPCKSEEPLGKDTEWKSGVRGT